MHTSKYIQILRTLSESERKEFKAVMKRRFSQQGDRCLQLFLYIDRFTPAYEHKHLKKEHVFTKLFPDSKTKDSDRDIRKVLNVLVNEIEGFIQQKVLEEESFTLRHALMEAYRKRGLQKLFVQQHRRLYTDTEALPTREFTYFEHTYKLVDSWYQYETIYGDRGENVDMSKLFLSWDHLYIIHKLRYTLAAIHRKGRKDAGITKLVTEVSQFLADRPRIPVIDIYFSSIQLAYTQEPSYFEQLHTLLQVHEGIFSPDEERQIWMSMINYCFRMNKQDVSWNERAFAIYQRLLTHKILFVDGYISPHHYKNITDLGLSLVQIEWVIDFLEEYKPHIHPDSAENAFAYNMANVYFHQKDFKACKQALSTKVNYKDIMYDLSHRLIRIKCYYELQEWEDCLREKDNLQQFVYNHKEQLSNTRYDSYLNFSRLIATKVKGKESVKDWREQARGISTVEKTWLLSIT